MAISFTDAQLKTKFVIRSATHDWVSIWPTTLSRENSAVLTVGSVVKLARATAKYDCDGNPRFRIKVLSIPVIYNKERGINFAMIGQKGWLKCSYIPSLPQPGLRPKRKKAPVNGHSVPNGDTQSRANGSVVNFQTQIKTAVREAIPHVRRRAQSIPAPNGHISPQRRAKPSRRKMTPSPTRVRRAQSYPTNAPNTRDPPPTRREPTPKEPTLTLHEVRAQVKSAVSTAIEPLNNRIAGLEKSVETMRSKVERRDQRLRRKDEQMEQTRLEMHQQRQDLKRKEEANDRLQRHLSRKESTIAALKQQIEDQATVIATQQNSISQLQAQQRWL